MDGAAYDDDDVLYTVTMAVVGNTHTGKFGTMAAERPFWTLFKLPDTWLDINPAHISTVRLANVAETEAYERRVRAV